ncbi:MAG: efflux RND transporter periplasmic adaptor subunit [Marinilabiliales bacterium]
MKKNKGLKYVAIITLILIIIAVIGKKSGWFGKQYIQKVSTEPVTYRTITETITANGKIQPETEVKISPDVSGEIVELNVQDGDAVKKGDLLLRIKPDIYESTLERMEASLNSAKANEAQMRAQLLDKETNYKRMKALWDKKAISDAEYETALTQFEIAKANLEAAIYTVKSAEASLNEAKENLRKTNIYAPISGTITKLNVELGERVVGTEMMAGTEILRIANLNYMEVKVEVNENDIIHVSKGDTAIIEVDAYIGKKFKGIVTDIANSANTTGVSTDQVTQFDVKIYILPDSYKHLIDDSTKNAYPFRPGMSASVDIQTKTKENVLSVPIQSVTTRKDTTTSEDNEEIIKEVVFLYTEGKVKMQEVKSGIQDDEYIEIIEGLKEGDEVVSAPYSAISRTLKDGDPVEKVSKEMLFLEK